MSEHDDLLRRSRLAPVVDRLHARFAGTFNEQTIERLLVDSADRLRAESRYDGFLPLLAERFAVERLRAVARSEGRMATSTPVVLFLCVHNAGRSQMAAAWMHHLANGRVTVRSGGSTPAERINPAVVDAMAELGIDLGQHAPKPWTEETLAAADVVVTMGCGDACPVLPGTGYRDWELPDPAGLDLAAVRPIRDAIGERVRDLLAELSSQPSRV